MNAASLSAQEPAMSFSETFDENRLLAHSCSISHFYTHKHLCATESLHLLKRLKVPEEVLVPFQSMFILMENMYVQF